MRIPRRLALHLNTLTLLTCAALSPLASAQDDVPGRVGRVALAQGAVSIGVDAGAAMTPAQVNWPVTTGTMITTARGARTELRIGSTSIRLDGDSSLEVTRLDDANLRLRLHYGSASVHVPNPEVLAGFALETPQAQVRLQQPARVRVDAERVRDTSAVEVFEGVALVDGGGSELTLRAGKGAELTDDDVRTTLAQRDAFDDWSQARDRAAQNAASVRYVGTDMTGYEDLDRYGSWRTDSDYGPLWTPVVPAAWVPYSDGSWVWLEPWGWTWVDNSPWGYTPFHYGRWVFVNHRWSWAPGRHHEHAVWAPALVGWVGGSGWNITLRDHGHRPASGWYPLSPHDRFVPSYRASENHLRWMNNDVRPDPHRRHDWRPQGLTVVPQERFNQPGRVDVAHAPRLNPAALPARAGVDMAASTSAPPPPPNRPQHDGRFVRTQERSQEQDRDRPHGMDTGRISRDGFIRRETPVVNPPISGQPAQPLGVNSPTPHQNPQALGVTSPTPHQSPQAQGVVSPTPHQPTQTQGIVSPAPQQIGPAPIEANPAQQEPRGWQRSERREQFEERRRADPAMQMAPQPSAPVPPQAAFEARAERTHRGGWERSQAQPAVVLTAPAQPAQPVQPPAHPVFEARAERAHRGEWERPREAAPAPAPAPVAVAPRPAPAPVMAAPAPAPAPVAPQPVRVMTAPPPVQAPAPAAAAPARPAAPAPQRNGGEQHGRGEQHGQHQQER